LAIHTRLDVPAACRVRRVVDSAREVARRTAIVDAEVDVGVARAADAAAARCRRCLAGVAGGVARDGDVGTALDRRRAAIELAGARQSRARLAARIAAHHAAARRCVEVAADAPFGAATEPGDAVAMTERSVGCAPALIDAEVATTVDALVDADA